MTSSDRQLLRAARRAATLAAGGPKAWLPPTKVIPSRKAYRRKAKHRTPPDE